MNRFLAILLVLICTSSALQSQVSYGSVAAYGLRKLVTTYNGNAVQVRRSCDDATTNIGFTTCGELDTISLKNFVLSANPLSAIASAPSGAYSLRRLNCNYTGSLIRVRSSAGGSVDIGYTANGDLDTVALKAFVGANNAFINIWYDQSGNGRNAVQTTNGNQPRIMTGGVIHRQNGKPAIRFLGTSFHLSCTGLTGANSSSGGGNITTANIVFQSDNSVNGTILTNGDGGTNRYNIHAPWGNNNTYLDLGNIGAGGRINTGLTWTNLSIGTFRRNGAQGDIWKDGTNSLSSGAMATNVTSAVTLSIGGCVPYTSYMTGYISELMAFPSALTTTEREYIEWSQSIYYNIAGPVLTTLPASPASASVAIWYDQTTTGANASPTVNTNQPLIMLNGIVQRNSTMVPAIRFNGAQKGLVANRPVSAYPITLSAVVSNSAVNTNGAFVKLGGLDNVSNGTSGVAMGIGSSGGTYDASGNSFLGLKEWILWCPSSPNVTFPSTPFAVELTQQASGTQSIYLNGVNAPITNGSNAVGASITGSLYIGGYRNATDRFPAVKETEVTVYNSSLNTTRRILLNSNQAAYHNVTITGTRYAPPAANSYHRYVLGIGRQALAANDSVCATRESVGMGFTVSTSAASGFLKDDGDFICAGMDCPLFTTSTSNIIFPVQVRWANDWYIDKTDIAGTTGGTVAIYFDFSDYNVSTTPGPAANYSLLVRPTTASNFAAVPSAAANVSGDRVYFTVDVNNLTDLNYYTIGTTNPILSPLPVELTNFEATVCEKDACLDWKTASEINSDHFKIERSVDATVWEEIKTVKAAGNSQRTINYTAMDYEPFTGISYYRLKLVDKNEEFKYSTIASVEFKEQLEVGIYPNPSTGKFNLSNVNAYDKIMVMDLIGRKVYEQAITKEFIVLDLNALENGSYFITFTNSVTNKKYSSKVVIDKKQ